MSTSISRRHLFWAVFAVSALLFLRSLVGWLTHEPATGAGDVSLDAAGLDALEPYLAPSSQLPPWLDEPSNVGQVASRGASRPDPWQPPPAPPAPHVSELAQHWSVTAILLRPGRRVAVLNNRQVRAGDVLAGGVRVAAIEADRVVLQGPGGERQVVWFNQRGEG